VRSRQIKILVADDDQVNLTAVSQILRREGHQVIAAADGLEAWSVLQRADSPQIALLDWMMPGLDGVEICKRLRSSPSRPAVYVLLLTSKAEEEDLVEGFHAGANDFLRKPFNPAELKARLDAAQRVVRFYNNQQLNLDQARKLLAIANAGVPCWVGINDELTLHLSHYAASSHRAGGDHCWARTVSNQEGGAVTLIGLRDQSGHEVSCILRSIATDLFHKEAIERGYNLEAQLAYLNDRLCASGLFAADDFVTGLTLELDHASLQLRYSSCGHPPMFLVRGTDVITLPEESGLGRNLPLGSLANTEFESACHQLQPGDRLILFTDGLLELGQQASGIAMSIENIRSDIQTLAAQTPGIAAGKLLRDLLGKIAGPSVGALRDDVTVLALELEPDAGHQALVFHPAGLSELDQAIEHTYEKLVLEWPPQSKSPQRLRLFLDEALTNAWQHGNRQDARLPIKVRWRQHNGFSVVVDDAGTGFDPARLPDPRSPARILCETGRGAHIIRNSCEWMQWKKGGTRLVARFAGAAPDAF
jgi:DNA-binding response OmpR family regulator/anti-sigma regulatory factor (Ser/Thr protein kinase)